MEWFNTPDREIDLPLDALARAAVASLDIAAIKDRAYETVMAAYGRSAGGHARPFDGRTPPRSATSEDAVQLCR